MSLDDCMRPQATLARTRADRMLIMRAQLLNFPDLTA